MGPRMADAQTLIEALEPLLTVLKTVDVEAPRAADALNEQLPLAGARLQKVRELVREGITAGWLCDRENAGVRFSRVKKSIEGALSIDAVHMSGPGAGHLHPQGEIDLCFTVSGNPTFDGRPEGWSVFPKGSWHVPTVAGGVMDILYFLPGGAITFGAKAT
jgi:hypothetical protein